MSNDTATTSSGNPLLDAAHVAAQRGFRVIPIHRVGGEMKACSCQQGLKCTSAGKHPMAKKWQDTPEMSTADIQATWDVKNPPNLGIATGAPSGFWVLDIDPDNGGAESAGRLGAQYGGMNETRIVQTGSGGYHYYFAMPDFPVTNSDRWFRENGYPGIDIRGTGGQVVAPPSVSGKGAYVLKHDVKEFPQAPAWLLEAVRPQVEAKPVVTAEDVAPKMVGLEPEEAERLEHYSRTIVGREYDRLEQLKVGMGPNYSGPGWNQTVFEVSCTLIQIANSPWSPLTMQEVYGGVFTFAPRDDGFTGDTVNAVFESARKRIGDKAREMPAKPAPSGPVYAGDPLTDPTAGPAGSADGTRPATAGPQGEAPEWPQRTWDDLGNAQRMVDHYGDQLRWIEEAGRWAVYTGGRWVMDNGRLGQSRAQRMIELLPTTEALTYSAAVEDPDVDKESPRAKFLKWVKTQRMSAKISACLKETQGRAGMQGQITDFDKHDMLLNVANGVVDLRTGELLPHDPALMLMQQSPVAYDPAAPAPRWHRFLEEVQPDVSMREYLQRISGYSISASIGEQAMFMHHGLTGANGKSVYLAIATHITGDYGQIIPRTTLLATNGDDHPTALARMVGKRFLQVSETAAGRRLDEEVVKNLTGGEKVTARYMSKDFFDYQPSGKIHYVTNHLPRLSDAESIWRRLHLIVWPVTIPEQNRDGELANKIIAEEAAGVLAWFVAGAVAWAKEGLQRPVSSLVDLANYRQDQDELGEFLRECLESVDEPGAWASMDTIYGSYQAWTFRSGIRSPLRKPDLARVLRERKYVEKRTASSRGFAGVRVLDYNGQVAVARTTSTDPLA